MLNFPFKFNSMAKITYLLGAGASANTIPVVANFHRRMIELKKYLESCLPLAPLIIKKPFDIGEKHLSTLENIIKDFDWLITQAGNYFTIDTLAKKFYLTDETDNLTKLKKCLVTYFTLEQYVFVNSEPYGQYKFEKFEIDKRYDSFIAAIAKKNRNNTGSASLSDDWTKIVLNNEIKILSWNYDIQFERSLQRFINKKIHFIQSKFQIYPNKNSLNESEDIVINQEEFSMVKLNGNAIWDEFVDQPPLKNIPTIYDRNNDVKENKILLEFYLDKYKYAFFNPHSQRENEPIEYFNFAWENDKRFREKYSGHDKNLETAELIASETQILVVIGYSFPIFNREIDNRLFNKMENLRKIYIQDIKPDRIKSTMLNAFNFKNINEQVNPEYEYSPQIFLEKNTNQFVIPYELNQE